MRTVTRINYTDIVLCIVRCLCVLDLVYVWRVPCSLQVKDLACRSRIIVNSTYPGTFVWQNLIYQNKDVQWYFYCWLLRRFFKDLLNFQLLAPTEPSPWRNIFICTDFNLLFTKFIPAKLTEQFYRRGFNMKKLKCR